MKIRPPAHTKIRKRPPASCLRSPRRSRTGLPHSRSDASHSAHATSARSVAKTMPPNESRLGSPMQIPDLVSRPDVGPALLLQFHYTHNARLHDCRLGNYWNFLVLDLVHIFLGIAAGFEGNGWRALLDRLDPRFNRRRIVAQHMQAGTESDDLDCYVFAEILVILRDICRVVEREIHGRRVVRIHLQDKVMQLLVNCGPLRHLVLLLDLRRRWR